MAVDDLALSLASTIRHDGEGGLADDLTDITGLRAWVVANTALLADNAVALADPIELDQHALRQVGELRKAIRALFARAVRPDPPSRADAHRLMPTDRAIEIINRAASKQPLITQLSWSDKGAPDRQLRTKPIAPAEQIAAGVARATIQLLTGPHAPDLRSCQAPRCVRYFIKDHPRQEWCKRSCGTRARVARHYRRHHPVVAS